MNILRKIWRALADNLAYYFAPCALVVVQGQTQLHDARKITVAAPSEP